MKKRYTLGVFFVSFATLLLMFGGIFFIAGGVTINVKDVTSNEYIVNTNIIIQPNLSGAAGPGTDGGGPFVYELHMPKRSNVYINAKGYKNKTVNLLLVPFKKYTIYLEPSS